MDKLERYLDQVCRRIGGPRSLRQHVRQELREHLLDAAAGHQAAGLSQEDALARALDDFGGAEEMRSELEATHGQRLMSVVIDKALQWKENTMKARWLWTTWACVALVLVIAGELLWIAFASTYLTPKFERLTRDWLIDPNQLDDFRMGWVVSFLRGVSNLGRYTVLILLLVVVGWGLFEWRVKSENKPFMRLSALGTAAVGLLIVAVLVAGCLIIPYQLSAPASGKVARLYAQEQIAKVDASVGAVEQALTKKDWEALRENANRAAQVMDRLTSAPPAVGALTPFYGEVNQANELQAQLRSAHEYLLEAEQAGKEKDAERLKTVLKKFHDVYEPIAKAAAKPQR
jgi:hypothetical protein